MVHKRGLMFIVLALLLFCVPLMVSEGETSDVPVSSSMESISDFYSLYHCNGAGSATYDEDNDWCDSLVRPVEPVTLSSFSECDDRDFKRNTVPSSDGCWFAAAGVKGGNGDVWAALKEGTKLYPSPFTYRTHYDNTVNTGGGSTLVDSEGNPIIDITGIIVNISINPVYTGDIDFEIECFFPEEIEGWPSDYEFELTTDYPLLCAYNHLWQECNEANKDKLTWANGNKYQCTKESDYVYDWILLGDDLDHDGYASDEDCKDDPQYDPDFCSVLYEYNPTITCDSNLKYRQCAKCINPGVPEICGDEINNDCRGGSYSDDDADFIYSSSAYNLEGKTPDSCNLFQQGCEGGAYFGKGLNSDGTSIDLTIPHNNIYEEKFSWISTPDGGYCCGYNGLEDLGHLEINSADSTEFICLKDDPNLVGVAGEDVSTYLTTSPSGESTGATDWSGCTEGGWCFVSASGSAKFKILTIKKLGQQPYDVVSDSKGWQKCDATNNFNQPMRTPVSTDPLNPFDSSLNPVVNSFYCYQEGDHYSWAENLITILRI